MPKEKDCTKLIPKIYKRNAENLGLFFFVNAQKQIIPTITLEQAIWNYFRFSDIEWDMESARATFTRLQREFYDDCQKHEVT
jgi:hypothetical protein